MRTACFCLCLAAATLHGETLPGPMRVDLKRLEETWRILDRHAQALWPGWTTYREVPFHFVYPNRVSLLAGHPSPAPPFRAVPEVLFAGRPVALDQSRALAEPLVGHYLGGGGPLPMGPENPGTMVELYMGKALPSSAADPAGLDASSDSQILCNVHELFHALQAEVWAPQYGNLRINPDANMATYAEVEGLALERAYREQNPGRSRAHVLDFMAARRLKRRSLKALEIAQEQEEEVREGTATFVEMQLLRRLQAGYKPGIGAGDDPKFMGFRKAKGLFELKLSFLRNQREKSVSGRDKCYFYGALQALLLTRHCPGWQQGFFEHNGVLEQRLREGLSIRDSELDAAERGLARRYPMAALEAKHHRVLDARDRAYLAFLAQKGRAFILSLKESGDRLHPEPAGACHTMGLAEIFPEGIQPCALRTGRVMGKGWPLMLKGGRFLKWVETGAPAGPSFRLSQARVEGDVHIDATFSCGGFTVKAARLRVRETPARVHVEVLDAPSDEYR